jgi:hypothetical protein
MKPAEEPVKVLYIVGFRRSGSTLLDIVLGNHPSIESVGELGMISRSGWIDNQYCGCGKRVNDCPFWSNVRYEWIERVGVDNAEKYLELQEIFHSYRSLPRMLRERRRPSPQFRAYVRSTHALFEAIREVSGKPIVLDSSKNQLRALTLSMAPGIDLYPIHLIRDVRGVAASQKKTFAKDDEAGIPRNIKASPAWNSAVLWIVANLLSELVRRQLGPGKSSRIRYEDFTADPREILDELGRLFQLDLTETADAVSAGKAMRVGHNIGGNRLRMQKDVQMRPGAESWKNRLSVKEQKLSWMLAGWLMRRYKYQE